MIRMALNIIVEDSKHCTPCKTKEKKIESQYYCTDCEAYYCEDCFELHPRVPYLAKHIVLKHNDIAVWSKLQYKCPTHDKNLEFYCGEHKMLCCHVCVSLKHRSCADMEYILESAKNICENDEIKTMIHLTQEKLDNIESYAKKNRQKTEINANSKKEYIKELDEYRSKLNKMFDVLMKNALEEMNETVDRNTKYSEDMTRELKHFEQELQDLKHQLRTSTAGKEVLIYISLKRGENLIEEITRKMSEFDITTDKDNFKPVLDNTIQEYVGNIKQIVYLEDEQMRKEAVSREECLMQSAVSSEEYQELTSVSYEGDKTTKSVRELVPYEDIDDNVQVNVQCKDTEYFVQENDLKNIEEEEILLRKDPEPYPAFIPFGKIEAEKAVPCEDIEVKESVLFEYPEPYPASIPVPCEDIEVKESVLLEYLEPYPTSIPVPSEDIEVKESVLLEEPEPYPEFLHVGKIEAEESVLCENYLVEPVEQIANKCFDIDISELGQYRGRDHCSRCGRRFETKQGRFCRNCGARRK